MISSQEIILRLVLALVLSGLIGWEREIHERPAGFRTHILVCLGATLIMLISQNMHEIFGEASDPGRIAAQVVSGIGFLGAGTIIREGVSVKGLTTAASLWAVAGIGLGVGAGFYFGSIVTAALVFLSLWFLSKIEFFAAAKSRFSEVKFRVQDIPGLLGKLGSVFGAFGANIINVRMEYDQIDGELEIIIRVEIPSKLDRNELTQKLAQVKGVHQVEWLKV